MKTRKKTTCKKSRHTMDNEATDGVGLNSENGRLSGTSCREINVIPKDLEMGCLDTGKTFLEEMNHHMERIISQSYFSTVPPEEDDEIVDSDTPASSPCSSVLDQGDLNGTPESDKASYDGNYQKNCLDSRPSSSCSHSTEDTNDSDYDSDKSSQSDLALIDARDEDNAPSCGKTELPLVGTQKESNTLYSVQESGQYVEYFHGQYCQRDEELQKESELDKKAKRREKIVAEILASETTYQNHLSLIVKHFQQPLRASCLIPEHIMVTIFSNIRQIISINTELYRHLNSMSIGQAFLQMGPFLKLYSTYANNHERALATLMEWDQKSPEFSKFRRSQEEQEELSGLKLNALLITPVQRIPRYKLLLEDLLKFTLEDHEDYKAIQVATKQISEVASHINQHIKQQDNFMKMLAIQKCLAGPSTPKLLTPGRVFIKEGPLRKVSRKGGKSYERMFFLFSDILMYAKPKLLESGAHHSYICCCMWPLQHCQVTRVFGHGQGQGALFTVKCKDESLLLYSDQASVTSWMTALNNAIGELQENRLSLRKVSSAKQPLRKAALVKLIKHERATDPFTAAVRKTPEKKSCSPSLLKRTLHDHSRLSTPRRPAQSLTGGEVSRSISSGMGQAEKQDCQLIKCLTPRKYRRKRKSDEDQNAGILFNHQDSGHLPCRDDHGSASSQQVSTYTAESCATSHHLPTGETCTKAARVKLTLDNSGQETASTPDRRRRRKDRPLSSIRDNFDVSPPEWLRWESALESASEAVQFMHRNSPNTYSPAAGCTLQ